MTQQDIMKQMAEYKKLQGDIKMMPSKLIKSKADAVQATNTSKFGSLKMIALKNHMKKLQEEGNVKELTYIMLNTDKWLDNEYKDDLATNYKKQALPIEWLPAIRAIGLDPDNKGSWKAQDWLDVDNITKAPTTVKTEETNLTRTLANAANPSVVKKYDINSFEGVRNNIINRRRDEKLGIINRNQSKYGDLAEKSKIPKPLEQLNLSTNTNEAPVIPLQDSYLGEDVKFYERTNRDNVVGRIRPNDKFPDGIHFASNGENYTNTEWDALGSERQFAIRPKRKPDDAKLREGKVRAQALINGNKHSYLYSQIDKNNKVIAEILSKPEFLRDMASVGGRFMINADFGKYGFTSDVQDIQFLFDKNKNQQFIKEIQRMRANNDTGGAVGNVSNFEVQMFMNASGAFQAGSSAGQLYRELITMRDAGTKAMQFNQDKFKGLYGQEFIEKTGIINYDPSSYDNGEPRTLKDALKAAGLEDFSDRSIKKTLTKEKEAIRLENFNIINNITPSGVVR
tara:strand:- start:220 stop:1752 length:1533 start_codon:yes stop_codon:yes gene_type:complete